MKLSWFTDSNDKETPYHFETYGNPPSKGDIISLRDYREGLGSAKRYKVVSVTHLVILNTRNVSGIKTKEMSPEKRFEYLYDLVEKEQSARVFSIGSKRGTLDYANHECEIILEEVE